MLLAWPPDRAAGHKEQDMPNQEQSPNAAPDRDDERASPDVRPDGDTKKP